jgi:hypothetical protein
MHSVQALVAQRKEISAGAREERLQKRYFYTRTARRLEEEGSVRINQPATGTKQA